MTHDILLAKEPLPNKFTLAMGQRIRQAREEKGWSQTRLADAIERRRASISDIENGKMVPDAVTLALMAAVFEKSIVYFFPAQWRQAAPEEEALSDEEQELLAHFRRIWKIEHRKMAINQIKAISEFEDREGE
ncbi:MAG: helix-turn-helix transcriptional regulator [Anaerolineae bacterium]|nr:helix-turn-helix transcriptional regulator [Anaerolineae bacterium]